MQSHGKFTLALLFFAATAAWAQTSGPQWQSSGSARYVCGGVSDEGMDAINAHRGKANGELLFTSGPEGAYLAQVAVTISGAGLKQALSFTSNGPLCLLDLPAGSYTVEAQYKGRSLQQNIKTQDIEIKGAPRKIKFNWPAA
jgi:hypothetical protein